MRIRRVVELDGRFQKKGRRARLWGYGYAELANLYGMPEGTVRQAVLRKKLKPGELGDVVRYWADLVFGAAEER